LTESGVSFGIDVGMMCAGIRRPLWTLRRFEFRDRAEGVLVPFRG
jgi:hypothetical protein